MKIDKKKIILENIKSNELKQFPKGLVVTKLGDFDFSTLHTHRGGYRKLLLMLPTHEKTQQILWGKGVGDEALELPMEIHL